MSQQQKTTPLMQMYFDANHDKIETQVAQARRLGTSKQQIDALRIAVAMIDASLEDVIILQNSQAQEAEIAARQEVNLSPAPVNTWIEPARPLENFSAFSLSCSGDPQAIERVRRLFPGKDDMVDTLFKYVDRWMVDCMDASGEVVFGLLYWFGQGWQSSEEVELCKWQQCRELPDGRFQECARCAKLRAKLTRYVCATLQVHGVENAGMERALAGLTFGQLGTGEKPAPVPALLIERYRERRRQDTELAAQRYSAAGEYRHAADVRSIQHIHSTLLDISTKIFIDSPTIEKILAFMVEIAKHEREVPGAIYTDPTSVLDKPLWIECARAMSIKDTAPLIIQGLLFARPGDPAIEQAFKKEGYGPDAFKRIQQNGDFWGVDLIDDQARAVFSFVWVEKRWRLNVDHKCPFGTCKPGLACPNCQIVYKWGAMWLGTILLARSGYFQELKIEPKKARSSRGEPGATPRKLQPGGGEVEHQYEFVTLNITSKVVHEPEPSEDENQAEHEPGIHWIHLHQEEEIEIVKQSAKEHDRHLRSGKLVHVKKSKERKYWRLRGHQVIEKLISDE